MNSDGLTKLYDTLTADERFRLRIRAIARGDTANVDRLDRACPRKSYEALDSAYTDRLDASDTLTLCVLVEVLPKLSQLRMLSAVRQMLPSLVARATDAASMAYISGHQSGIRAAWSAAGKRGAPPELPVEDDEVDAAIGDPDDLVATLARVLDGVAEKLAAEARTPRDALADFCREELGLSVEDLLGAWAQPALAVLEEHRDALDAAEVDAASREMLGRCCASPGAGAG